MGSTQSFAMAGSPAGETERVWAEMLGESLKEDPVGSGEDFVKGVMLEFPEDIEHWDMYLAGATLN